MLNTDWSFKSLNSHGYCEACCKVYRMAIATCQTYVAVYMLGLGLGLVLGLFPALLGSAHFAMTYV